MTTDSQTYVRCIKCGEYVNDSEAEAHRCLEVLAPPKITARDARARRACTWHGYDNREYKANLLDKRRGVVSLTYFARPTDTVPCCAFVDVTDLEAMRRIELA